MNYEAWEAVVPAEIREDSLWKMEAYRLGLFLSDLAWLDSAKLFKNPRTIDVADQLSRAIRKIGSNIAEGYSRGTGKSHATFYEYALGSTRESRDWYYKGRYVLTEKVYLHRLGLCTQLIRLLIRMTENERRANRRLTRISPSPTRQSTLINNQRESPLTNHQVDDHRPKRR
jgi:four helix bundle protein